MTWNTWLKFWADHRLGAHFLGKRFFFFFDLIKIVQIIRVVLDTNDAKKSVIFRGFPSYRWPQAAKKKNLTGGLRVQNRFPIVAFGM